MQRDRLFGRYARKQRSSPGVLHRDRVPGRPGLEMGIGRTGDGPVGFVAMTIRRTMPLFAVVLLAGCKAAPQIAAVVTGGAAGAATGSPAVGFAIGVATDAGANYAFRYI